VQAVHETGAYCIIIVKAELQRLCLFVANLA